MPITIYAPDALRLAVEGASAGKNTVMYSAKGYPSYMVVIPKFNLSTIDAAWPGTPHPAFIVNGVTKNYIYVGKYAASLVDGEAVSLPGVIPAVSLNFDAAFGYCSSKGVGWHLHSNAEWAAVALQSWKNGKMPRGNSNWGLSSDLATEGGRRNDGVANGTASGDGKTLTGSGPATWNHDGSQWGIADLCGNVWEWVGGMRQNSGEINVLEDNNAADNTIAQTSGSAAWKAVLQDESLVAPGTALTLKYDGDRKINTSRATSSASFSGTFETITAAGGVTIPNRLKYLALAPAGAGLAGDYSYFNNQIESLPIRGGGWSDGASAGVFELFLFFSRSNSSYAVGFRVAFAS